MAVQVQQAADGLLLRADPGRLGARALAGARVGRPPAGR